MKTEDSEVVEEKYLYNRFLDMKTSCDNAEEAKTSFSIRAGAAVELVKIGFEPAIELCYKWLEDPDFGRYSYISGGPFTDGTDPWEFDYAHDATDTQVLILSSTLLALARYKPAIPLLEKLGFNEQAFKANLDQPATKEEWDEVLTHVFPE